MNHRTVNPCSRAERPFSTPACAPAISPYCVSLLPARVRLAILSLAIAANWEANNQMFLFLAGILIAMGVLIVSYFSARF